jgi:twinkle protein
LKAQGKEFVSIVLDPLTRLVSSDTSVANQQLTEISDGISKMAKDLGFFYIICTHLNAPKTGRPHEEGGKVHSNQFTGSRAMMRACYYMMGIERDKTAEDEDERNTSQFVLLEDRAFGNSGRFDVFYNRATGDYLEPEYSVRGDY